MLPVPDASSCTVAGWQAAAGVMLSTTIKSTVQGSESLAPSLAVSVTVVGPTPTSVPGAGLCPTVTGPQLSDVERLLGTLINAVNWVLSHPVSNMGSIAKSSTSPVAMLWLKDCVTSVVGTLRYSQTCVPLRKTRTCAPSPQLPSRS